MSPANERSRGRAGIARGFGYIEDILYVGLGLLLAGIVILVAIATFISFGKSALGWNIVSQVSRLLDQILLILLLVELLYTVQVSFREHALLAEPFLLVGLISVIRRVLVLTAALGETQAGGAQTPALVTELGVMGALILALSISLVLVRKRSFAKTT
jgi:uncharacterized membrane protein (DUF373 family)